MSAQNKEEKIESSEDEEGFKDNFQEEEEEYQGRNWKQILIGILFVLIVVIAWYVISAITS